MVSVRPILSRRLYERIYEESSLMKMHNGSSTAGHSAITLTPRSRRSLGVAHISAIARERAGLAMLLVVGFVWACDRSSELTAIESGNEAVTLSLVTT